MAAILFAAASLVANCALATGFFVDQQSTFWIGHVGAGSAAGADHVTSVFFNPAGLSELGRSEPQATTWVYVGAQLLIPHARLRNTGSTAATPMTLGTAVPYAGVDMRDPADATPIPNIYAVRRIAGAPAYIGFGITEPFGLASDFRDDWFGRYDSIHASLKTVNLSGVAAWEVNEWLTIGGGLDVQYARSTLSSAIPDPLAVGGPTPATDGRIEIEGDSWAAGFNVGLLLRPDSATRIGVHFRSPVEHKLSGSSTVTGLNGPLAVGNGNVGASAKLKLPAILSLGAVRAVTDKVNLLGQVELYGWNRFEEIRVRFADSRPDAVRRADFRNAVAAAVGVEYEYSDAVSIRGGVRFDSTPTVDAFRDTTLPDQKRVWLGLGASWKVSPRSSLDFAYAHAFIKQADISLTRTFFDDTPLASTVRVVGAVDSSTDTLSIAYRYAY